jgi:hypothetical protein
MKKLHLVHKPHQFYKFGLWHPADHISQIALKHFSGGCVAIDYHLLDEIIYIAGLHGWQVTTEGDPKDSLAASEAQTIGDRNFG